MTNESENKRPVSFYENDPVDTTDTNSNNNATKEHEQLDSPTMTHCLNTTVPQNIASPLIGGKHTPTRNSLRHSRMIVLNRSGQAIIPKDIPFIRFKNWLVALLVLIFLCGSVLCLISFWIFLWSPNSRPRDNPYWSAVPVLLSSIVGVIFIRCFPKEFPRKVLTYWIKAIKYVSISMSTLAAVACVAVFIITLSHIVSINHSDCLPLIPPDNTCQCTLGVNSTEETVFTSSYHYLDFNCTEVKNVLRVVIVFVCVVNLVVFVCELCYLYMHWLSRSIFYYSRVPDYGKEMKLLKTNM